MKTIDEDLPFRLFLCPFRGIRVLGYFILKGNYNRSCLFKDTIEFSRGKKVKLLD